MSYYRTKLRAIGKSAGIILPKELLNRMNVSEGDALFVCESSNGYVIRAENPEMAEQIEAARRGISRYRNTLKALAE